MAVIVEDGTIVAGANSYASTATADTYHENQGNTTWDAFTDEVKEAGMVRGTLMLESRLRGRWIGFKTNNNQGVTQLLAWPRKKNDRQPTQTSTAVDPDPKVLVDGNNIIIGVNEIPLNVTYACMEAAFMHASGSALIPDVVSRSRYVTRTKVDVIEQEFSDIAPSIDRFPLIDQLLQGLAIVGGVNLNMVIGLSKVELDAIANTGETERWLDSIRN